MRIGMFELGVRGSSVFGNLQGSVGEFRQVMSLVGVTQILLLVIISFASEHRRGRALVNVCVGSLPLLGIRCSGSSIDCTCPIFRFGVV